MRSWISFQPPFFVPFAEVEAALRGATGKVNIDPHAEELLKGPLRCHRCGAEQPNMTRLKEHIGRCTKPFPLRCAILQ